MPRKILAIDDELYMLSLLERVITEKTPYKITTINNPLEATTILEKERFDIVITDVRMPGVDGMEILQWMKENNRTEEVIVITAFSSSEGIRQSLENGAFDHIAKPFHKEQILFTVERAMRCQDYKQELARFSQLFEHEPFEEASRAFQREYVQRLATSLGGDFEKTARRSGLSETNIMSLLTDDSQEHL